MSRRTIVGVMGSGSEEHLELSEMVGRLIAREGHDLLTGGGGGVMRAVARSYTGDPRRRGISIGILRAETVPNEYVELPIRTHLPLSGEQGKSLMSRNHINVLTADVVIVLPGEAGTKSELELAIEYGRPLILAGRVGGRGAAEWQETHPGRLSVARDEEELTARLREALARSVR